VPVNSRQRRPLQKNNLCVSRALLRSNSDNNLMTRAMSPEQLAAHKRPKWPGEDEGPWHKDRPNQPFPVCQPGG
ncbi:hypothetical protein M9458_036813, partial [Cirrhinus mrigala]